MADLSNLALGRRFSLVETAAVALAALLAGIWLTHNILAQQLQRAYYDQAVAYQQYQAIRTRVAEMSPVDRMVFAQAISSASQDAARLPKPAAAVGGLRLMVLGPDPSYLDALSKAIERTIADEMAPAAPAAR